MSRGWESKTVESQQAEAQSAAEAASVPGAVPPPVRSAGNIAVDAEQKRQRQSLEMQRERILSERTSSPHRRTALTDALNSIEEKLTELGWTVHL